MAVAGQTVASGPGSPAAEAAPTVVGTLSDHADLGWAQGRFTAAGLEVPEIDIEFHDDDAPCEGNLGTVRTRDDGRRILRVCAHHDSPAVRQTWRRKTLVHELAHVWEARTVDDEARDDLLALRGLSTWNDRSIPWEYRGIEHAAEIITWGIGEPSWRIDIRLPGSCDELAEGYELLTGSAAPRVLAEPCN